MVDVGWWMLDDGGPGFWVRGPEEGCWKLEAMIEIRRFAVRDLWSRTCRKSPLARNIFKLF
ncbi:MAG: hypothetical protein B7Z54_04515 [Sphingobacteriales bacterium 12-47-4]|nr:MAG: hypothetical protein B7Z54_04515 [Sphingobacteriales bacterium 12-47-4]